MARCNHASYDNPHKHCKALFFIMDTMLFYYFQRHMLHIPKMVNNCIIMHIALGSKMLIANPSAPHCLCHWPRQQRKSYYRLIHYLLTAANRVLCYMFTIMKVWLIAFYIIYIFIIIIFNYFKWVVRYVKTLLNASCFQHYNPPAPYFNVQECVPKFFLDEFKKSTKINCVCIDY